MIRPCACWGAACDLLGMSVVYPAGGTVTISKKSPLIRILSKRTDCIEYGRIVKPAGRRAARPFAVTQSLTGSCRGRRPRRPAEAGGGANSPGGMNPSLRGERSTGGNGEAAGRACPAPTGRRFAGSYLSIRHACKLLVISPCINVDTRSTRAAGSAFMPVRTHSSVRPTKAYL